MKLATLEPRHFESSAEFTQDNFVIGDETFIIEVLRSKLYSNPVRTLVTEIMTNARDAHIEAGKFNLPIEVKLPNTIEPFFAVRDYGIGINPERMKSIFVRYGVSSKRESNEQVGGYGLGAKSPWSYTDTFNIITNTPDTNGIIMRREYVAYIDTSRKGKLVLVSEQSTDDAQGTTIAVPCKNKDAQSFEQWVKWAAQYWGVQPIIKGSTNFTWREIKYFMKESDWAIEEVSTDYNNPQEKALVVVDGIPYKIGSDSLFNSDWWNNAKPEVKKDYKTLVNLLDSPLRLFFKTGEIYLTANREEIDYQTAIIERIILKLNSISDSFRTKFQDKMNECKNLWEAGFLYKKMQNNFKFLPSLTWKNIAVDTEMMLDKYKTERPYNSTILCYDRSSYQGNSYSRRRYRNECNRISHNVDTSSRENNHEYNLICVDDKETEKKIDNGYRRRRGSGKNVSIGKLQTIFETYINAQKVFVIIPESKEELDLLKTKYNLDLYCPIFLSTVKVKKKDKDPNSSNYIPPAVCPVKRFNDNYWAEENTQRIDTGDGYYVSLNRKDSYIPNTENLISDYDLKTISNHFKITIYGIPKRFVGKLGKHWKPLSTLLLAASNDLSKKNLAVFNSSVTDCDFSFFHIYSEISFIKRDNYKKFLSQIKNRSSLIYKYINKSIEIEKIKSEYSIIGILNKYGFSATDTTTKTDVGNELENMQKMFTKKYPLFVMSHNSMYCYNEYCNKKELIDNIVQYITMKDGLKNNKN